MLKFLLAAPAWLAIGLTFILLTAGIVQESNRSLSAMRTTVCSVSLFSVFRRRWGQRVAGVEVQWHVSVVNRFD